MTLAVIGQTAGRTANVCMQYIFIIDYVVQLFGY